MTSTRTEGRGHDNHVVRDGKQPSRSIEKQFTYEDNNVSKVAYVSHGRIARKIGALRIAYLPGESQPVTFSVHGAIAQHYKVDPAALKESHASTLDYAIAATAG